MQRFKSIIMGKYIEAFHFNGLPAEYLEALCPYIGQFVPISQKL